MSLSINTCCNKCNMNPSSAYLDVNQYVQTNITEKLEYSKWETCSKVYMENEGIELHRRQNYNPEPVCSPMVPKCNEKSLNQGYKSTTFTTPERFQCAYCVKSYKHRTNLITHEKTHLPISHICDICNVDFKLKSQLKSHEELKHSDVRPFNCNDCDKTFKLKQQLDCHQLTHQNHRPFWCEACFKTFKLKQQLQNHLATHSDVKPFQCRECNKCFRRKQQLEVHFRVHDKLKPFECQKCGKAFSLRQNLNVHYFKHSDNKPFQCEECGKGFTTKQNMKVHQKVHKKC